MSTVTSGAGDAARQGFYESALAAADASALREARALSGLDDEVALLRVQLRRAFADAEADPRTVQAGVRLLVQALLAQHRLSPQQAEHLGEAVANVLEEFGEVLGMAGSGDMTGAASPGHCPAGIGRAGALRAALAHPPALGFLSCGGQFRSGLPRRAPHAPAGAHRRVVAPSGVLARRASEWRAAPAPPHPRPLPQGARGPERPRGCSAMRASERRAAPAPLTPALSRKGRGGRTGLSLLGGEGWGEGARRTRSPARWVVSPSRPPGGGVGAEPPHQEHPRAGGWAERRAAHARPGWGVGAQPPTRGDGFRLPPDMTNSDEKELEVERMEQTEQRGSMPQGERLAAVLRRIAGVETRERPPADDLRARIDYLERDGGEMRTRVNGLFFGLIALAAGELLMRALAG